MEVRNNVRQRRRERIQQLTGARSAGWENNERERRWLEEDETGIPLGREQVQGIASDEDVWEHVPPEESLDSYPPSREDRQAASPEPAVPTASSFAASDYSLFEPPQGEPDPERWWKEKQRQERGGFGGRKQEPHPGSPGLGPNNSARPTGLGPNGSARPTGSGSIGSLSGLSPYGGLSGRPGWDNTPPYPEEGSVLGRFVKGFIARAAVAAALFGTVWAWTIYELPGSNEVQGWTIRTVTEDMNFAAVEAWYERTFGGTPSFLPIFEDEDGTQAVSAGWNSAETAPPLSGRILQSFAQSGEGVQLAALDGTPVQAVHTGRVAQVAIDDQGLATIKIQHENNVVSIYSRVAKPAVKTNDWVEAGRPIGVVSSIEGDGGEGMLEFAVQQNGKPIDPSEVVPLD
ncbi:M23 family metallopeptidase [Cohnella lubricantis]|uniref:Peptidoglycan DD-metalloendopeptidase family protein n=1 Tax=Cohnella lubricantis TaxID=2163172 RepID=A0A841TF79_9BACL|nr:M23 family metallopeptidase [Cohnella lubricantis]MBB6677617.1 peptidoglycan DD-metalloendopeptidase family protein [Cohnella lubricantis]MBP2116496.1 stage IV sporulation protein FA [Cohnella lubricantis]